MSRISHKQEERLNAIGAKMVVAPPPKKPQEIVMINNRTVLVDREVAEEIRKLRQAVSMARKFLEDTAETEPNRGGGGFC